MVCFGKTGGLGGTRQGGRRCVVAVGAGDLMGWGRKGAGV
jgi:hypothetical protein